MKNFDEASALSILFANTKTKKRTKDWLSVAYACAFLTKLYGSQKVVAQKADLSDEMIRQFLAALKLPKEVQKLVSDRKIDSIDVIKELATLKEPSKQIAAANAFLSASSKDVRDIKRLMKQTNAPVSQATKAIMDTKPKGVHFFIVDFEDALYKQIIEKAKSLKIKPAELVRNIVMQKLSSDK